MSREAKRFSAFVTCSTADRPAKGEASIKEKAEILARPQAQPWELCTISVLPVPAASAHRPRNQYQIHPPAVPAYARVFVRLYDPGPIFTQ